MPRAARTITVALAVAVLGVAGAACGSDTDRAGGASPSTAVVIKTFAFAPQPVRVKAGQTVTWTNQDQILHTVTAGQRTYYEDGPQKGQAKDIARSGEFDQKLDGVGSTFSHRFDTPGTYHYLCTIHPGMDAEVDVT